MKNLMFKTPLTLGLMASLVCTAIAQSQTGPAIPHLEKHGDATQLIVDGKPFLVLGGELNNSSASSLEYMKPLWPRIVATHLNTVLATVTWELIEPQEGKFDFKLVDGLLQQARANNLHLVILWFGSWKNGKSTYQPLWVKNDQARFPLAASQDGKAMPIMTTLSDNNRDADARAFAALMRHLREADGKKHTVLMIQVENEVGVLGDTRDYSPAANQAFAGPVPKELMDYLVAHKDTLVPELRDLWAANGSKTSGTWTEVFGPGKPADMAIPVRTLAPPLSEQEHETGWRNLRWPVDEIFMAWNYARYVGYVAAAGKREYKIPMYVNAWLQQRDHAWPGTYPSGGPVPQVHDLWRFGAPNIDFLSPDLYIPQFDETCERFTRNGNPLFIPEANTGGEAAAHALTALLKFNGIGFSPFGIDGFGFGRRAPETNSIPPPDALAQTCAILDFLAPEILVCQGKGTVAFLQPTDDTNAPPQNLKLGDYNLSIGPITGNGFGGRGGFREFGGAPAVTNVSPARFVINTSPGAYVFVAGPASVTFTPNTPAPGSVALGSFDESILTDGRWVPGRRLNGDETDHDRRWQNMRSFGIYRYTVFQRE